MRIEKGLLVGTVYMAAALIGRQITPRIVVLHDTAGRLTKGNSAAYLASSPKVSVHFVIERDGEVIQLVPTDRRAAHAGQSAFNGAQGCNDFSIGIEIVNPGRMTRVADTVARTWWGEVFSTEHAAIEDVTTPEHGQGLWMRYTEEQVAAVLSLLEVLFRDIPTLTDITTHWYISPGRKVDTNPLFPLEHVHARILGRDDPADTEAAAFSDPSPDDDMVRIDVPGDAVNLRRWPSFNPNILTKVPHGVLVPVLRRGRFDRRDWLQVTYGGQTGWIVADYTHPPKRQGA
jgi:N-acetylmuramoyl-L-alanine amidase